MKIVISSSTDSIDGPFDPRFGRAAYFCLVDSETEECEIHANASMNSPGGAGIQAAQFIAEKGAQAAVSGDFGPKAYRTLSEAGIKMFLAPSGETLTCRDLLARFQQGKLNQVGGPTKPGHHGIGGGPN